MTQQAAEQEDVLVEDEEHVGERSGCANEVRDLEGAPVIDRGPL